MNLLCRLEHLHGQTLLVEGREYFVGQNGVCADLHEEHARVLLDQEDTWCLVHPEDLTRPQEHKQVNTWQPEGVQHVILPPGETFRVPLDAQIETDPEKITGRTKHKKKGRFR